MAEEEPVLDGEKLIEKSPSVGAESRSTQGLNPVHTCPNNSINSQGDYGQAEGVGSELEQLLEALPFVETADDFALVVEGSPRQAIEDAIALQPDQPRRRQLREWLEATLVPSDVEPAGESNQGWRATVRAYAELLAEGLSHGVEAIKSLLKPWSTEERRGAFLELEQQAPQKMEQLVAIAPDCFQWCDV
jgi:hypothetical protein